MAQHPWLENDCLFPYYLPVNTKFEEDDIGDDTESYYLWKVYWKTNVLGRWENRRALEINVFIVKSWTIKRLPQANRSGLVKPDR